jgi:hypothetical protein
MRLIITIGVVLFVGVCAICQNIQEDIMAIGNVINSSTGFGATVTTTVFSADNIELAQKSLIFKNKQNKVYYEIDSLLFLQNGGRNIVVDKANKIIRCYNIKKEQQPQIAFADQLKESLSNFKEVKYKGIANGKKHYEIVLDDVTYSKTDLFIDVKTNFYSKIIYYHNNNERNGIAKKTIMELSNVLVIINDELFEESQFFVRTSNKLKPTGKYNGFNIQQ